LSRESFEIAVPDFHLHRVCTQPATLQSHRDVFGLCSQAGAENSSVLGVAQKRFLAADALDRIAQLQWTIILPQGELLEFRAERADQRLQIAGMILQIAHRIYSRTI
jgi:hypothetical protein